MLLVRIPNINIAVIASFINTTERSAAIPEINILFYPILFYTFVHIWQSFSPLTLFIFMVKHPLVYKNALSWIQQPQNTKRREFSRRGFLWGILIFTRKETNGFPLDSVQISGHRCLADGWNPKRVSHSLFRLDSTLVSYLGVRQCDSATMAERQEHMDKVLKVIKTLLVGPAAQAYTTTVCTVRKPALHHLFSFLD